MIVYRILSLDGGGSGALIEVPALIKAGRRCRGGLLDGLDVTGVARLSGRPPQAVSAAQLDSWSTGRTGHLFQAERRAVIPLVAGSRVSLIAQY
jgi:hypothetical protein